MKYEDGFGRASSTRADLKQALTRPTHSYLPGTMQSELMGYGLPTGAKALIM